MRQAVPAILALALHACADAPPPSGAARREPERIAGLRLGEPMTVPECSKERTAAGVVYTIPPARYPCWRGAQTGLALRSRARAEFTSGQMALDPAQVPRGLDDDPWVLRLRGAIVEVSFQTRGAADQQRLFRQLVDTYGPPSRLHRPGQPAADGGPARGIEAEWRFPQVRICFSGVGTHQEAGHLTYSSPEADAYWEAKGRPPR
ncbi:hypothetical protein ACFOED_08495 [Vulcaniibacterium thermophilum]|jgi:hypothetical protein|uniref:Uncharacterized protein n=1 Tax=Vulcaniibacterium thermophilum TaxID=1169913 RepID=A0A919DFS3_9GAMM|nr:hypothetical protein [Vulcaniibacterium thermophilum]GHE43868.1 hypothetical protein GCM10007167_26970 [Vulcaniibacterium thermophilum]